MNFFRSLQTASDRLHGRFPGSGATSNSLAGFAHLSSARLVRPVSGGLEKRGRFSNPSQHQGRVWARHLYFKSEIRRPPYPLAPSSIPKHPNPLPNREPAQRDNSSAQPQHGSLRNPFPAMLGKRGPETKNERQVAIMGFQKEEATFHIP